MANSEYLKKMKEEDKEFDEGTRDRNLDEIVFRQMKALEIIAETLISIDNRMQSNEGINVDVRMS